MTNTDLGIRSHSPRVRCHSPTLRTISESSKSCKIESHPENKDECCTALVWSSEASLLVLEDEEEGGRKKVGEHRGRLVAGSADWSGQSGLTLTERIFYPPRIPLCICSSFAIDCSLVLTQRVSDIYSYNHYSCFFHKNKSSSFWAGSTA